MTKELSNNILAIMLVAVMILSVASTAAVYFVTSSDSITATTAVSGGPTSGKMALEILPTPDDELNDSTEEKTS